MRFCPRGGSPASEPFRVYVAFRIAPHLLNVSLSSLMKC
jgi:hypothetical protein